MAERGLDCALCGRQTLHRRRDANHILWAVLTLFSCGLFAIVWIISNHTTQDAPWLCTTCGTTFVRPGGEALRRKPAPVGSVLLKMLAAVVLLVVLCVGGIAGLTLCSGGGPARETRQEKLRGLVQVSPPDTRAVGDELALLLNDKNYTCGAAASATVSNPAKRRATWTVACSSGVTYEVVFDRGSLTSIDRRAVSAPGAAGP